MGGYVLKRVLMMHIPGGHVLRLRNISTSVSETTEGSVPMKLHLQRMSLREGSDVIMASDQRENILF